MKFRKILFSVMMVMLLAAAPLSAQDRTEARTPLVAIPSFAPVVEKAAPAVVNISVVQKAKKSSRPRALRGGEDFLDRFFGMPQTPDGEGQKREGQGSGFIFDPEGYVITNNHVVEDADEITVKLNNGRRIKAEIIGLDPKTDLALIKLQEKGPYPTISFGNSSELKVGDWVVAIGNPLGLDQTVTSGIISGRDRKNVSPSRSSYDNFLQTDAAINRGNSGGPLLNVYGEVIGINSLIATASAFSPGNMGIGFAIPSDTANDAITQLKVHGQRVRGCYGVMVGPVDEDLAKGFGMKEAHGALVRQVMEDGPNASSKLKPGDIIINFDGKEIREHSDLPITVAGSSIGKKVKVVVLRDNKEQTIEMTVGEMKDEDGSFSPEAGSSVGKLGLTIREITPEIASRFNFSEGEGLYIAEIESGSPAAESGLNVRDVILEINSQPVRSLADYRKLVSGKKPGDMLRFLVKRGTGTIFFAVKVVE